MLYVSRQVIQQLALGWVLLITALSSTLGCWHPPLTAALSTRVSTTAVETTAVDTLQDGANTV
jgi:hypothetical protein